MFSFVPRKVARPTQSGTAAAQASRATRALATVQYVEASASTEESPSAKGKEKAVENQLMDDDYAVYVILALSDHAIWADADLRRTMASGDETYIPLSYLMRKSAVLSAVTPLPSETVLARSLRTFAKDILDVRMVVAASSHQPQAGGFEVRRCDWRIALQRCRNYSRNEWEERTVYMENIPLQFRSVSGIYRFTQALTSTTTNTSSAVVQRITLPSHHQDRPGDIAKCKGFALVTLLEQGHSNSLASSWPWRPRRTTMDNENDAVAADAVKFGFRTLPKASWSRLNEEYQSYRQQLANEVARVAAVVPTVSLTADSTVSQIEASAHEMPSIELFTPMQEQPRLDTATAYPKGCLVFARNIHPETNKTTLRAFFSQAFTGPSVHASEPIDYVDFNKGMQTCYLRLISPLHTQTLVAFFAENLKFQTQGLDSRGEEVIPQGKSKAITMEIVDGAREELYWMKVPEKLRRQAADRAEVASGFQGDAVDVARDGDEGKRKRKRRKRA